MGRNFRDSHYQRYVKFGKRTVKDGEAAVIWNMHGEAREVVGPRLVRLFYSNVRFLTRHVATRDQYLVISYRNGDTEHVQGPRAMFENPVDHISIKVASCFILPNANTSLVVYTENRRQRAVTAQGDGIEFVEKDGREGIERSIITGPQKFMPEVNQTVHTFEWDRDLNMLDTSERQWTLGIDIVSSDSIKACATIVFSLAFPISGIERLLQSKNPFIEMQNALNADLSGYGSQLTWDEIQQIFREDIRKKETLTQFYERASTIGVEVRSILLKGLEADRTILAKIQAKLDAETKFEQDRRLALERQKMEVSQMEQRQKLEKNKLEAQNQLIESQQLLARKEKEHALAIQKEEDNARAFERERRNKETLTFLKEMKDLGVNLDSFLAANTQSKEGSFVVGTPALKTLQGQITPSERKIQVIQSS